MLSPTMIDLARYVEDHEDELRASPDVDEETVDKVLEVIGVVEMLEESIREQTGEDVDVRDELDGFMSVDSDTSLPPRLEMAAKMVGDEAEAVASEMLAEYRSIVES